jgi:hypothetical protein
MAPTCVLAAQQAPAAKHYILPARSSVVSEALAVEGRGDDLSPMTSGHGFKTSCLNFSVSVMIAAENGPIPALHNDTGASGTRGSNPVRSSSQSVSAVNPEAVCERPRTLAAVCGWLGT